jgi:hypothetical protein
VNDFHGIDMAVNASPQGSPERIHDGTDDEYWTGSALLGNWIFDSVDQAYTGSKSVDGTGTTHNSQCQFLKMEYGSPILFDLINSTSITGWIYLESWPETGVKRLDLNAWDTVGIGQIGITVNIGDYINTGIFNVWQKFTIILEDMSLVSESIDSIRIQNVSTGAGSPIEFYIDEFKIDSALGSVSPKDYIVTAPTGYLMFVDSMSAVFVDAHDSKLADATMPKLAYDKLLNNAFEIGMLYRRIKDGEVLEALPLKSLFDFYSIAGVHVEGPVSCGVNTMMQLFIEFKFPVIFDSRTLDYMSILLSEDFSVFKELRWGAQTRLRKIE